MNIELHDIKLLGVLLRTDGWTVFHYSGITKDGFLTTFNTESPPMRMPPIPAKYNDGQLDES